VRHPTIDWPQGYGEVFSPGILTQVKGAAGVAGQGFSESSTTSGAGSRQAALGTFLA
jgi:hypothetical protein